MYAKCGCPPHIYGHTIGQHETGSHIDVLRECPRQHDLWVHPLYQSGQITHTITFTHICTHPHAHIRSERITHNVQGLQCPQHYTHICVYVCDSLDTFHTPHGHFPSRTRRGRGRVRPPKIAGFCALTLYAYAKKSGGGVNRIIQPNTARKIARTYVHCGTLPRSFFTVYTQLCTHHQYLPMPTESIEHV